MFVDDDEGRGQVNVVGLGVEEGSQDTVDRRHGLVPQAKDEDTHASPLPQVVDLSPKSWPNVTTTRCSRLARATTSSSGSSGGVERTTSNAKVSRRNDPVCGERLTSRRNLLTAMDGAVGPLRGPSVPPST